MFTTEYEARVVAHERLNGYHTDADRMRDRRTAGRRHPLARLLNTIGTYFIEIGRRIEGQVRPVESGCEETSGLHIPGCA